MGDFKVQDPQADVFIIEGCEWSIFRSEFPRIKAKFSRPFLQVNLDDRDKSLAEAAPDLLEALEYVIKQDENNEEIDYSIIYNALNKAKGGAR